MTVCQVVLRSSMKFYDFLFLTCSFTNVTSGETFVEVTNINYMFTHETLIELHLQK